MGKTIGNAVREVCLSLPGAEESLSHGSPNFKVEGKPFAIYSINHHGDGRVALWLHSPAGAQELYSEMEPDYYYIPPYVGPKGWLGVELNKGLEWSTIAKRVREAYEHVAPARMSAAIRETVRIEAPDEEMKAEEIDPFLGVRAQEVLGQLQTLCHALPETAQTTAFGSPVWKAGKKTFAGMHYTRERLVLQFWVGPEQQALLSYDSRYTIPAYIGHNGWIELDVEEDADWREIEYLLLTSYRHFALKRMLKALDSS